MSAKSKKWKTENKFFINFQTGKIQFHLQCQDCPHDCKQSHKITLWCRTYNELTAKRKAVKNGK